MIFVLLLIVIFIIIISLDLGLSIGAAYIIIWLLPNISFESSLMIGAICANFSVYFFVQLVVAVTNREMDALDKPLIIGEYDEDLEEEYHIIQQSLTPLRKKRKRRR